MQGFTLIEVLVALGLLGSIAAIGIPTTYTSYQRAQNGYTAALLHAVVSHARALALSHVCGHTECLAAWSVHVTRNELTLFSGSNYSSRDQRDDIRIPITGIIGTTGAENITFTDDKASVGSIELRTQTGKRVRLEVNQEGGIIQH